MGQELEYLKVANSPLLWIACIPAVALVMVQAFMFARRAWKTGPQMGVSKEQMVRGAKSAAIASLGPSLVIVIGAVSLLASVGGPLAWMRLLTSAPSCMSCRRPTVRPLQPVPLWAPTT